MQTNYNQKNKFTEGTYYRYKLKKRIYFWLISTIFALISFTDAIASSTIEKTKKEFISTVKIACIQQEAKSNLGRVTSSSIIESKCSCFASDFVEELFANKKFQQALSTKKNDLAYRQALEEAVPREKMIELGVKCTNFAFKKSEVNTNIFNNDLNGLNLKKTGGLNGDDRKAFVDTVTKNCIDDDKTEAMRSFCLCIANDIADNLSEYELAEMLMAGPEKASSIMLTLQTKASHRCM